MKKIYLCMLIVAFCSCMVHAQTLHRYVVEVETVPDKREYKAEKLVNGNVRLENTKRKSWLTAMCGWNHKVRRRR